MANTNIQIRNPIIGNKYRYDCKEGCRFTNNIGTLTNIQDERGKKLYFFDNYDLPISFVYLRADDRFNESSPENEIEREYYSKRNQQEDLQKDLPRPINNLEPPSTSKNNDIYDNVYSFKYGGRRKKSKPTRRRKSRRARRTRRRHR
jgi:hypothetical protein